MNLMNFMFEGKGTRDQRKKPTLVMYPKIVQDKMDKENLKELKEEANNRGVMLPPHLINK